MPGPEITARSVRGCLAIRFAVEREKTRLVEASRTTPFQLQRLLYLDPAHPQLASATILNSTAGLFSGDRLHMEISAGAGTAVAIGTPTMTRAFAMPAGEAVIETVIRVGQDAYVEYLPEPLLLCRDAAISQRIDLSLKPGARIAFGEVITFGREAMGERHAYRWLRQRLELRYGHQTTLAEALSLEPGTPPEMLGLIGRFSSYGSLLLICEHGREEVLLAGVRALVPDAPDLVCAASRLNDAPGIAVRVLAASAFLAQGRLRSLIDLYRESNCPA